MGSRDRLREQAKLTLASAGLRVATRLYSRHYVGLDYPPNHGNEPRWTAAKPHRALCALLGDGEDRYVQALGLIRAHDGDLCSFPVRATDPREPSLINDYLPGLDTAAIYTFIRERKPAHYVEVGSGNSTKVAARAKRDGDLATLITSIDPYPRDEIDVLCDTVIRRPLEQAALERFSGLEAGDVVFFDGSHSVFMGNDVTVFFLEVLPALPAGVLVGIHDIYLPFDYPEPFAGRYYTEQYMLAAYLLGRPAVEVVLPAHYAMGTPALADVVAGMWDRPGLGDVQRHGVAFWLETR